MPVLNLCVSRLSGMPTFHRSFIYIAFELHYLLKDLKETTLRHFLFVSLHQIRVKCGLVTQCRT